LAPEFCRGTAPKRRRQRHGWWPLYLDMEEVLNEAVDAAHATHLVGHGLRYFVGEHEASAVAASAWATCRKVEALRRIWNDVFKAAALATS
jgi:hypothetical protein